MASAARPRAVAKARLPQQSQSQNRWPVSGLRRCLRLIGLPHVEHLRFVFIGPPDWVLVSDTNIGIHLSFVK